MAEIYAEYIVWLDKMDIIHISLNIFSFITLSFGHSKTIKKDIPCPVIITVQECPFYASFFSGVHCGCLAFSDFGRLKFSPTSSPHFFLICAKYSEETLSPVRSTSVRAEQRSTGALAPFESKTTNRFNVACKWKTVIRCGALHCISMLCEIL